MGIGNFFTGNDDRTAAAKNFQKGIMEGYEKQAGMKNDALNQYGDYALQNADKYLDPSLQYQQQEASKAVNAGFAGGGSLRSGAAMKALADRSQQIASTGYADAYNRALGVGNTMLQGKTGIADDYAAANQMGQQARMEAGVANASNTGFGTLANVAMTGANMANAYSPLTVLGLA